jgi:2-hydroxychromene-2-carboxylate isomerase
MVKLDIRTCFDSIKQDKLFDILKGVLSEVGMTNQNTRLAVGRLLTFDRNRLQREYAISRYVAVVKNRAYPLRKFEREVRAKDDHIDFPEFAFQLAGALRKAVFVDQVKTQKPESREEVLRLLQEHVEENVVKVRLHSALGCQPNGLG